MGKVVDITEKLSFEENPKLKIKDVEITINADAETMLKIMGALSSKNEAEATLEAYNLLFNEKERNKLARMKMPFKSLKKVIEEAMNLVLGEEEGE